MKLMQFLLAALTGVALTAQGPKWNIPAANAHLPVTLEYTLLGDLTPPTPCPGCGVSNFQGGEADNLGPLSLVDETKFTIPQHTIDHPNGTQNTQVDVGYASVEPFNGYCELNDQSDCVTDDVCYFKISLSVSLATDTGGTIGQGGHGNLTIMIGGIPVTSVPSVPTLVSLGVVFDLYEFEWIIDGDCGADTEIEFDNLYPTISVGGYTAPGEPVEDFTRKFVLSCDGCGG